MGKKGRGMARKLEIDDILALESEITEREDSDRLAVVVPPEKFHSLMLSLKNNEKYSFDFLLTHTAIDWKETEQFELVYLLYSMVHGHHLQVSVLVSRDEPIISTVSDIWTIATWQEREVFDLMGVLYDGHTDLRRLFLEDGWKGHPLRKDYVDEDMLERPK